MAGWMLYVHALSPLHNGTGAAVGVIDLPVARERVTTWPYLPGSSLKGVLRDAAEAAAVDQAKGDAALRQRYEQLVKAIFGPDTQHADEGAGAVWFADAHLLCFPVRSFRGTFAWVTCRLALERWLRDLRAIDGRAAVDLPPPPPPGSTHVAIRGILDDPPTGQTSIALEDIDLPVVGHPATGDAPALAVAKTIADTVFREGYWHAEFQKRFAVVDDDTFTQLAATATEVVARIRLDPNSKTVAAGALWYEEAVPAEAIFAAPLGIAPRRAADEAPARKFLPLFVEATAHQIGGHAGVGRGLVRLRLA